MYRETKELELIDFKKNKNIHATSMSQMLLNVLRLMISLNKHLQKRKEKTFFSFSIIKKSIFCVVNLYPKIHVKEFKYTSSNLILT